MAQTLDRGGYTEEQVLVALRGVYGARRIEVRYELLDADNRLLDNLTSVCSGKVSHDGLAEVKRTAKFTIIEGTDQVDYLRHRIKPYVRVYVPDIPEPGQLRPSTTYDEAVGRFRYPVARWRFDEQTGTTAVDEVGVADLAVGAGTTPGVSALLEDQGRAVALDATPDGLLITGSGGALLNSRTALSFAGWFRTDEVGIDADLLNTTVEGSWGDFLQSDWGELGTTAWGDQAALAETWRFYGDDTWGDLGSWGDLSPDVGGLAVRFGAAGRDITVTLMAGGQQVSATTPANTHVAERTLLVFTWASGADLMIYLNGELVASADGSGLIGALQGIASLAVGGFDGVVDDFAFTAEVLTPSVVRDLYVTGAAIGPAAPPSQRFVEFAQGVFLLSSPSREIDAAGVVTRAVDAYDQSVVLKTQLVEETYYVAAGQSYTDAVAELLANTPGIPSYAVVPSAEVLPAQRSWDANTSHLKIVNDLLSSINYDQLSFDEHGTAVVAPYVEPQARTASYVYDASSVSVLVPGATQSLDLYDQPNRWVLVVSEANRPMLRAVYVNDDPASPTSTVTRGRLITFVDRATDVVDQTALDAKVRQLAQEATQVYEEIDFSTALMPFHGHRDVIELSYPGLVVTANYSEVSWSYDLAPGARMQHKARRVVELNGSLS